MVRGGCEVCNFTGSNHKWNPHLNVFIEAAFLEPEYIDSLKVDCKRWLQNNLHVKLIYDLVIHYNYYYDEPMRTHKLKYVTRATWRFNDEKIINVIHGFKTSQSWGKWEKIEERTSDVVALEKGKCHKCNTKIEWGKIQSVKEFNSSYSIIKGLDGGYFEVQYIEYEPPPEPPEPEKRICTSPGRNFRD